MARRTAVGPGEAAGAPARMREFGREALAPVVALAFIAVLQNVDVIVVRHQFGEDAAGAYAAAAVAAKIVVWTAVGVGLYLIPGAAARAAEGRDPRPVLLRALGVVAAVAAPALLVMIAVPELVLRLGFGEEYVDRRGRAAAARPRHDDARADLSRGELPARGRGAGVPRAARRRRARRAAAAGARLVRHARPRSRRVVLAVQVVAAIAVLVPSLRRVPAPVPAGA